MKKLLFLTSVCSILLITSCDTRPECEKQNVGSIKVDNYIFSDYDIYIDNAYKGSVDSFGDITFDNITAGTYATEYVRTSGTDGAAVYTLSVNVQSCETFTVKIE